jgi:Spy/CpxP family protein refolding chaperone
MDRPLDPAGVDPAPQALPFGLPPPASRPPRSLAWMLSPRALDSVAATAVQRAGIRDIMLHATAYERQRRDQIQRLRLQLERIAAAPALEPRSALRLQLRLRRLHCAVALRRRRALLAAAAVLTAEQRRQLASRFVPAPARPHGGLSAIAGRALACD